MYNHPLNTNRYFGLASKMDKLCVLSIEYLEMKLRREQQKLLSEASEKIAEDLFGWYPILRTMSPEWSYKQGDIPHRKSDPLVELIKFSIKNSFGGGSAKDE